MDNNEENGLELNPDDIVEVIELNNDENDAISGEVDNLDLQNNDDIEEDDSEDELLNAAYAQIRDDADIVFRGHTDSVFSVSVSPGDSRLAVTGGQDDKAYVWSTETGHQVFECTGHKDSVTSVGFSHDGSFVCTADLNGLIKVWKVDTKAEVWSFECSDVEWIQWHPLAPVLLVGTVDGDIWMWKIPGGDCRTFQGHGKTVGVGRILPDGKRVCGGYEDGCVKVWDLKSGSALHSITGHEGHSSSIVCMDCHQDNNLLLTGSTDVTAKVINTTTGKVLSTFNCQKAGNSMEENSVEACAFSSQQGLAATGTLAGTLCIWDLPTQTARITCPHEAGIVRLRWSHNSPLVYTASLDGIVRMWDGRNGQCAKQWTGHIDSILDLDITRDEKFMVTVSDDNTARVFSLVSPDG